MEFESEEIYVYIMGEVGWEKKVRGEHKPSNRLRRKERPRRINIQPTLPLLRPRLNRMRTSYHAGKTTQHIHASELLNGKPDRRLQLLHIRDVHIPRPHFCGREICFQGLDFEGRVRVVEIEEREAGEAVFE